MRASASAASKTRIESAEWENSLNGTREGPHGGRGDGQAAAAGVSQDRGERRSLRKISAELAAGRLPQQTWPVVQSQLMFEGCPCYEVCRRLIKP
jgi:hypothetical protein